MEIVVHYKRTFLLVCRGGILHFRPKKLRSLWEKGHRLSSGAWLRSNG